MRNSTSLNIYQQIYFDSFLFGEKGESAPLFSFFNRTTKTYRRSKTSGDGVKSTKGTFGTPITCTCCNVTSNDVVLNCYRIKPMDDIKQFYEPLKIIY